MKNGNAKNVDEEHTLEQMIPVTTIEVNSWEEVKTLLNRFGVGWVFRGQSRSDWLLTTSLERANIQGLPLEAVERFLYREFTRSAHQYVDDNSIPGNELEWFAMMQHYGTPTRLLDWTLSLYVASFFAIEDARDVDSSCAVWAVYRHWFGEEGLSRIRESYPTIITEKYFDLSQPELFHRFFIETPIPSIIPVEPYKMNQRFRVQQGCFLCMGDVNRGFIGNLLSYDKNKIANFLYKIIIPNRLRTEAIIDLNRMNINRETLFPGIDGFAQSLLDRLTILTGLGSLYMRAKIEKNIADGYKIV